MANQRTDADSLLCLIYAFWISFPVAGFILAAFADFAYQFTENLQWLHMSEWLLVSGVFGGVAALLLHAGAYLVGQVRPAGLTVLGGLFVVLLAVANSFVHTADGWTAVVPTGVTLSVFTVLAMAATAFLWIWSGRQ